jgi:heme exporter protein D
MMPELGKYAAAVLSSYAISVGILALLCAFSLIRARRVRRDLAALEERMQRNG